MISVERATIAHLQPEVGSTQPSLLRLASSVRPMGSFRQSLHTVSRQTEASRDYLPGDPVRLIDWKAFGRTDHLIVRQHREEAGVSVLVMVSACESMNWPDLSVPKNIRGDRPTKLEVAMRIGAYLAYRHLRAGDQVDWAISVGESAAPLFSRRMHSAVAVHELFSDMKVSEFAIQSIAADWQQADMSPTGVRKHGVVYAIDDGLNGVDLSLFSEAQIGLFIQLLSSLETNIDWFSDRICYFDESRDLTEYPGDVLQVGYRQGVETWRQKLVAQLRQAGVNYFLVDDRTPIGSFEGLLLEGLMPLNVQRV